MTNIDNLDAYNWFKRLDERQQKEIRFSLIYAKDFAHGTNGHNQYMLVAKLTEELCKLEAEIDELTE